jgi:hypothetical protein
MVNYLCYRCHKKEPRPAPEVGTKMPMGWTEQVLTSDFQVYYCAGCSMVSLSFSREQFATLRGAVVDKWSDFAPDASGIIPCLVNTGRICLDSDEQAYKEALGNLIIALDKAAA